MSRAGRWSLILLCVGLALFGLLQPDQSRQFSATTFGVMPFGFGALYDTLRALEFPVERSFAPLDALPPGATMWWIDADGICEEAGAGESAPSSVFRDAAAWIAAGGTAVVFPRRRAECDAIAGITLPVRAVPGIDEKDSDESRGPLADAPQPVEQVVSGRLTPQPRHLEVPPLATFVEAGGLDVVAAAGERPFILEKHIGAGRLIVVADLTFLRNQWLDGGDDALLAVDLVRAYGAPRFDERLHGLRQETHPLRYLLRSSALPALFGLLLLGVLFAWRGQLVPARSLDDGSPRLPTLTAFVDSMAQLYAGTGDYASVGERYRALTAARLRRHFALPPETPLPTLMERLRTGRRGAAAELALLSDTAPVRSAAHLEKTVHGLDALLREVTR